MSEFENEKAIVMSEEELKQVDGGKVQFTKPEEKEGFTIYQIKWGDTLSGLAGRFGCKVKDIMEWNPYITNPGHIYATAYLYIRK